MGSCEAEAIPDEFAVDFEPEAYWRQRIFPTASEVSVTRFINRRLFLCQI